ncbi:hypothetical protein [Alicyclobacillus sendaiensis]|uniref:hypothetical protein n=1 Tax=Alicyclobacillus sendaiensis TaxID=192387 RepID=UPI0026F471C3|nr:hypothetical protein [Alicyclobacillus sendaiensis]
MFRDEALIESKALREVYIHRVDVLDKVKALRLLPDDMHATIEMVAEYYEVGKQAVVSLIHDNREELESDGLKVLRGDELTSFKELGLVGKNASAFTIIPRRAILRIGMLLRDSEVAKEVRTMLLNIEETARKKAPEVVDEALAKREREIRLRVIEMNAQTRRAKLIFDTVKTFKDRLSDVAVESLISAGSQILVGYEVVPRPQTERLYSASDIARMAGVTANKVGRIAKQNGLQTAEYGVTVLDQSPYSAKQVSAFRYNEKGVRRILELLQQSEETEAP